MRVDVAPYGPMNGVFIDGRIHAGFRDKAEAERHAARIRGEKAPTGYDWCTPCNADTDSYNAVCVRCGCRAGADVSVYTEHRDAIARFLFELVYGSGSWDDYREGVYEDIDLTNNYLADADGVLNANRHLLPLDVREAMYPDER